MSLHYLLDTNTVSYLLKGRSARLKMELSSLQSDDLVSISSITEAEILYGFAKVVQGQSRRRTFAAFLQRTNVLSWGSAEAAVYSNLRAEQERAGKPLDNLDMLIAAHAISVGATLVTSDKAFLHVRGLRTSNWATDIAP